LATHKVEEKPSKKETPQERLKRKTRLQIKKKMREDKEKRKQKVFLPSPLSSSPYQQTAAIFPVVTLSFHSFCASLSLF
jgi:hypothetical protein